MTETWEQLKSRGYIDSRDILERLHELEAQDELDEDETEELDTLRDINRQGEDYASDWQYGATMIPRRDWVEYAQELAEEIGAISPDAQWPLSYIDWEEAANALEMDYSSIEVDGVEYLVRQ